MLKMNRVVIHRRVDSDKQNTSNDASTENVITHIAHRYPFKSLNSVPSHILPHFVVFNTGQKCLN